MKRTMTILCLLFFFSTMAHSAPVKEWTFLIFLNAKNSLDRFGDLNLKQMEEVGSTDQINIVVQWGSLSRSSVKRMLIQKSTNPNEVTSPVIEDLGAVDMGSEAEFLKFLKWGAEKFPAKKYFVDVWNHGSGWHKKNGVGIKDISYDDLTGSFISTEQLGSALKNFSKFTGSPVELYGSDACLMSMMEVASEMGNSVKYFAGSQDLEPGPGWPYNEFLKKWAANPSWDGKELGKTLSEEYFKAYSGGIYGESSVTFSLLQIDQLPQLESAISQFISEAVRGKDLNKTAWGQAISKTQGFAFDDYKDLKHFLANIKSEVNLGENLSAVEKVEDKLNSLIVVNYASAGFPNALGVSIWMPKDSYTYQQYQKRYKNLILNQKTNWLELIDALNK